MTHITSIHGVALAALLSTTLATQAVATNELVMRGLGFNVKNEADAKQLHDNPALAAEVKENSHGASVESYLALKAANPAVAPAALGVAAKAGLDAAQTAALVAVIPAPTAAEAKTYKYLVDGGPIGVPNEGQIKAAVLLMEGAHAMAAVRQPQVDAVATANLNGTLNGTASVDVRKQVAWAIQTGAGSAAGIGGIPAGLAVVAGVVATAGQGIAGGQAENFGIPRGAISAAAVANDVVYKIVWKFNGVGAPANWAATGANFSNGANTATVDDTFLVENTKAGTAGAVADSFAVFSDIRDSTSPRSELTHFAIAPQ